MDADTRPPTVDAALDRIRAWARSNKFKPARVASLAGLSDGATRKLFDDDWAPTVTTLRAIEAVMPADWAAPAEAIRLADEIAP